MKLFAIGALGLASAATPSCVGDNPLCGLSGENRQICALREEYGCSWAGSSDPLPVKHKPMPQPDQAAPTRSPTNAKTTMTTVTRDTGAVTIKFNTYKNV